MMLAMSLGLRFTRNLQVKILLFMAVGATSIWAQSESEVDSDTVCLQSLRGSLSGKAVDFLTTNWTGPGFPCSGNTSFAGLLCSNQNVREIKLVRMELEGSISPNIVQCTALSNLDLSDNRISGPIPQEIGQLVELAVLNLSLNNFEGEIPEFTKATYTNVIDLHGNRLSGMIPSSFGFLERLTTFDVSNNDLSGPIPSLLANTSTGAARFNASSFKGNKGLYGYPLAPPDDHGLSVLAIVGIGLGSGMLSLIVSFTAVCIWLRVTDQRGAAEEGKISQLMPES